MSTSRSLSELWLWAQDALTVVSSKLAPPHPPPGCLCTAMRRVPAMAEVARFSRRAGPAFHLTWGICQRVRRGAVVVCPSPHLHSFRGAAWHCGPEEVPPPSSPSVTDPSLWLLSWMRF